MADYTRCWTCNINPNDAKECTECLTVYCAAHADDIKDGDCRSCKAHDPAEVNVVLLLDNATSTHTTFELAELRVGCPNEADRDIDHFTFRLDGGRKLAGFVYGRALQNLNLAVNPHVPGMRGAIGVYDEYPAGWDDDKDEEVVAYRPIPPALVRSIVDGLRAKFPVQ